MTSLGDHRRYALATAAVISGADVLIISALLLAGRAAAVPGLLAGSGVALLDVLLLARGLDRFRSRGAAVGARALATSTFMRFALVGLLVGLAACTRGVNPIGVFVGFMLLPFAIVAVGSVALWRESHPTGRSHAAG